MEETTRIVTKREMSQTAEKERERGRKREREKGKVGCERGQ